MESNTDMLLTEVADTLELSINNQKQLRAKVESSNLHDADTFTHIAQWIAELYNSRGILNMMHILLGSFNADSVVFVKLTNLLGDLESSHDLLMQHFDDMRTRILLSSMDFKIDQSNTMVN